jgi:hypothetical protein
LPRTELLSTGDAVICGVAQVDRDLGIAHQALVPTEPGWLIEVEAIAII